MSLYEGVHEVILLHIVALECKFTVLEAPSQLSVLLCLKAALFSANLIVYMKGFKLISGRS